MHGIAELLSGRRRRVIGAEVGVVRLVAIRTPVALHLPGIGIDHGDPLIQVAVGDIRLIGLGIDPDLGDAAVASNQNRCTKNSIEGFAIHRFFAPSAVSAEGLMSFVRQQRRAQTVLVPEGVLRLHGIGG